MRKKELIYRHESSQFEGDAEFAFKHALLRDVTYESVLKRDRVAWHRAVAEWLVWRSGEEGDRFAAVIADHFERAGLSGEAATWYGRAANHEYAAYANETAVEYYRRAIDFASEAQAVSGESGRGRRIEWYRGMAEALGLLARFDEAIDAYERMRAAAAAAGDKVAEAQAWNGRAFIEQRQGDYQGSLASAERAEELAAEVGDSPEARIERVTALVRMSDGYFRLGAAQEQGELAERALEIAVSMGDAGLREQALSLKLLGMAHQVAGRFEEARRRKEEALEIFRRMDDIRPVGMMLNSLGETLRLKGDYAAARDRYQEALTLAHEGGTGRSRSCASATSPERYWAWASSPKRSGSSVSRSRWRAPPAITFCRRRIASSRRRAWASRRSTRRRKRRGSRSPSRGTRTRTTSATRGGSWAASHRGSGRWTSSARRGLRTRASRRACACSRRPAWTPSAPVRCTTGGSTRSMPAI